MARQALACKGEMVAVALSDAVVFFANDAAEAVVLRPTPESDAAAASAASGLTATPTGKPIQRDAGATTDVVALVFNGDGTLLIVADADKTVRVWSLAAAGGGPRCVGVRRLAKKLTALAVAPLAAGVEAVCVGDKTGEVCALPLPGLGSCAPLLGHTASIVTGLAALPPRVAGGRWQLASSDRDEKVRVSRWPQACVIDAYCLGHTEYVTAVAALPPLGPRASLASISGDGAVRLWDGSDGTLLGEAYGHAMPHLGDAAGDAASIAESIVAPEVESEEEGEEEGGPGLVPVALAASDAGFGGGSAADMALAVAFAGSPSAVLFGLPSSSMSSSCGPAQRLPCLAGVALPEPPAALTLASGASDSADGGIGFLLALCPSPPLLHRFALHRLAGGQGLAARPAACGAASKLVAVAGALGVSVLPALAMADHDLAATEGGDGADEDGAGDDGKGVGATGEGCGKKNTKAKGELFDLGTSELRKKKVSNTNADWNSKKRFKGKGEGGGAAVASGESNGDGEEE